MKFEWQDGLAYCRCLVTPKIVIPTHDWGGTTKPLWIDAVGFVKVSHLDTYEAHIYGTVSPISPKTFAHLSDAKAYVEEQSLIGLTVKKLGV